VTSTPPSQRKEVPGMRTLFTILAVVIPVTVGALLAAIGTWLSSM